MQTLRIGEDREFNTLRLKKKKKNIYLNPKANVV